MAETDAPPSPAPENQQQPTQTNSDGGDAATPEWRQWVPEKYESPEAYRKGHDEAVAKLTSKTDALKTEISKELETARLSKRPESPDKYEVRRPRASSS